MAVTSFIEQTVWRRCMLRVMASRVLDIGVAIAAVLSAALIGLMLAAPLLPQQASAPAPLATATAIPSATADARLPPLGLYLLREPFAFGACLAMELEPRSYPVGEDAPPGTATVMWWVRGRTSCETRTGEVQIEEASVTPVFDEGEGPPDDEPVGYAIDFTLPASFDGAVYGPNVPTQITILAGQSTQDVVQALDTGGSSGQGLVFDRVEVVDPPLDPLPSATPVAALEPVGLYVLEGPLLSADGPCLVLVLDEAAYTGDPTVPGAATIRWWERGGADPADPAACLTRSSDVTEVPASVAVVTDDTGAPIAYAVGFAVPLSPGGAPDDVEIGVDIAASSEDALRAFVTRPAGDSPIGFVRVDSIDPPLAP
jgi:hypothetical protein